MNHVLTIAALMLSAPFVFSADAGGRTRISMQMAAGQCQPFVPTSQVRYSASGLRNAGASTIYVVCSEESLVERPNYGVYGIAITLSNRTNAPAWVSCTARPGYVHGSTSSTQLASPKSISIKVGLRGSLTWGGEDFGGEYFPNPNYTCAIPPGVEINFIRHLASEDVGA